MSKIPTGRELQRLRGQERERVAREVLARWQASATTRRAFCRDEGISVATLRRWLSEFSRSEPSRTRSPRLVEVALRREAAPAPGTYQLVLRDGVEVRVPFGFDPRELAGLLEVLGAC